MLNEYIDLILELLEHELYYRSLSILKRNIDKAFVIELITNCMFPVFFLFHKKKRHHANDNAQSDGRSDNVLCINVTDKNSIYHLKIAAFDVPFAKSTFNIFKYRNRV